MKKIFLWTLIIVFSMVSLFVIIEKTKTKSGTIVWSQTSVPTLVHNCRADAIAVKDDSLYLAGYSVISAPGDRLNTQWVIEKRNISDGSLVENFGVNGIVISNLNAENDRATDITADSDYLYIAGIGNSREWRIEKRNLSDGSLVEEFGDNSDSIGNISTGHLGADEARALTIDNEFIYVVGGQSLFESRGPLYYFSDYQWRIGKHNKSDGLPVGDFGDEGIVASNPSTVPAKNTRSESANAIAIDSDFMYIAGGDDNAAPVDKQWRVEKRYQSDGSLVTEFGDNGVIISNPSPSFDEPHAIAVDSNFMYVAGHDSIPGDNAEWRIEKRNLSDGSLVTDFGSQGVISENYSSGTDWAHAIVLDSEKSPSFWRRLLNLLFNNQQEVMYIVGRDENPGHYDQQWRIEKRSLMDGSLISEFGDGGVVTVNPSKHFELADDIAIDENYIYVVGVDESLGLRNHQWRIVKIKK